MTLVLRCVASPGWLSSQGIDLPCPYWRHFGNISNVNAWMRSETMAKTGSRVSQLKWSSWQRLCENRWPHAIPDAQRNQDD